MSLSQSLVSYETVNLSNFVSMNNIIITILPKNEEDKND